MSSGWAGNVGGSGPGPGPSGDHTVYIEQFTLTPANITSQSVGLTFVPIPYGEPTVNVEGGPEQIYGSDFVLNGQQITWAGLGLAQLLDVGDILVVAYPITT